MHDLPFRPVRDVALEARRTMKTIRNWIKAGLLPEPVRSMGCFLFRREEVNAALAKLRESGRIGPAAESVAAQLVEAA